MRSFTSIAKRFARPTILALLKQALKKGNMKSLNTIAGIAAMVLIGANASAISYTYGFLNISHNKDVDAATGEAQLFVDVSNTANPSQVLFTFRNTGPNSSSICDIYFEEGTLLDMTDILNNLGTSFSPGANPTHLPQGNTLSPKFDEKFSVDSDPAITPNGVGPYESVSILFTLKDSETFASTIAALNAPRLRIGIHVQGFEGGGSESFINNPRVPDGGSAVILLGLTLLGLETIRRRKSAQ